MCLLPSAVFSPEIFHPFHRCLQSQRGKKAANPGGQRRSREGLSASVTPIRSRINDTKKSSSRWSQGLGSLKYKQIKPQNKLMPFKKKINKKLHNPARSPALRWEPGKGRKGERGKAGMGKGESAPGPAPRAASPAPAGQRAGPAHLPCRSSPASSPAGSRAASWRRRAGSPARLGHRRRPGRPMLTT